MMLGKLAELASAISASQFVSTRKGSAGGSWLNERGAEAGFAGDLSQKVAAIPTNRHTDMRKNLDFIFSKQSVQYWVCLEENT
jgi:hypothetical protein